VSRVVVRLFCPDCGKELVMVSPPNGEPYHVCPPCHLRFRVRRVRVSAVRTSSYFDEPDGRKLYHELRCQLA